MMKHKKPIWVQKLEPQTVVLYARESSKTQADHLKHQKCRVKAELQKLGFTVLVSIAEIAPGWKRERKGFLQAIRLAKARKAVLVAESLNRFRRSRPDPDGNQQPLSAPEMQELLEEADGVQLATLIPPDAPAAEVHGLQTKRGQEGRGHFGGRPRIMQPKKARRLRLLAKALQLHERGESLRSIGRRLKVPHNTISNWLKNGTA